MPGPTVHVRLTIEWAMDEGLSEADARAVAAADLEVDRLWPGSRTWGRHFNPTAALLHGPRELRRAVAAARAGDRDAALTHLGRSLHSRQDAVGHGRLGQNHLLLRLGWRRDPDVWATMPPSVQARIERATRAAVRAFVVRAAWPPAGAEPPREPGPEPGQDPEPEREPGDGPVSPREPGPGTA